jgi:hypothetical protein
MMTTEQFYANYEFTDEKENDNGELTEDRVIEMLDAFYDYKINNKSKDLLTLADSLKESKSNYIYNEAKKLYDTKETFNYEKTSEFWFILKIAELQLKIKHNSEPQQ